MPEKGRVIVTPNHFSQMDHFFAAVFLHRKVQFMAKSQLFEPAIKFIFKHGGAFRRRGHDQRPSSPPTRFSMRGTVPL
jgi:1-acyl-sn-glycerol-3-phosphate acyltransferase